MARECGRGSSRQRREPELKHRVPKSPDLRFNNHVAHPPIFKNKTRKSLPGGHTGSRWPPSPCRAARKVYPQDTAFLLIVSNLNSWVGHLRPHRVSPRARVMGTLWLPSRAPRSASQLCSCVSSCLCVPPSVPAAPALTRIQILLPKQHGENLPNHSIIIHEESPLQMPALCSCCDALPP